MGLGIRNLQLFNTTLLGKWVWKVNKERMGIWFEALVNKYLLNLEVQNLRLVGVSNWWKAICNLNVGEFATSNEYLVKYSVRVWR